MYQNFQKELQQHFGNPAVSFSSGIIIPDNNYDTLHVCKGKPTDPFFVSIETNALLHKYIQYFSYSEDAQ